MAFAARSLWAVALPAILATSAQADGDSERGVTVFKKCRSCHMVGEDAKNRVGPHLNDLFGRAAASVADYDKYSPALTEAGARGLVWNDGDLDQFLADPKAAVPGTRMTFRGLSDEQDRADVIAFLATFSEGGETGAAGGREVELDAAILALDGDPEYGEYLSAGCTTCHQASGEDKGIPSIVGWSAEDFVYAMHAYKLKVREHPVMQMMAGKLSAEEIAALAAYFASSN